MSLGVSGQKSAWRSRRVAGVATVLLLLAAATVYAAHETSDTEGQSTVDQTICGPDPIQACGDPSTGFKTLNLDEDGEARVVREDLAPRQDGRESRRTSLAYFGQITDFQLSDEESPAREERFDAEPFQRSSASGYRPQEPLVVQETEASIRQMNEFLTSPVAQGDGSHAQMDNAVMTGDLADSMQKNETEWVRTLLEGSVRSGKLINPNSGTTDFTGTSCPPGTPVDNPLNYTGVGDYDDYALDNPIYYDPESPAGGYSDWPTYPGLFDRAQVPFHAEGVGAPVYVVFGNHDALYQGTVSAGPGIVSQQTFEEMAVDCLKPVYPLVNESTLGTPPSVPDLLTGLANGQVLQVPPDVNRQFVDKHQFKDIFRAPPETHPDDFGFSFIDSAETTASNDQASYYSWPPKPGVRYIVLDTNSESGSLVSPSFTGSPSGGHQGNVDHPQWLWLQQELADAQAADELIVVFAHHNVGTLTNALPDEAAPCLGGNNQFNHNAFNPSCDRDPRTSTPLHSGDDLAALFHQYPNVVSLVAGHTHQNEIVPFPDGAGGGFWQITTAAVADWPPQHRVIELMDNRDGSLSIFGTTIDHEGDAESPPSGTSAASFDVGQLASIGRTLNYNDPQQGPNGSEGDPVDRNVELLIGDPREADLEVSKADAPDPIVADQELTYTVTVTNNGPSGATSATLTDHLPPTSDFVSSTPSQGVCVPPVGGDVACPLGDIAAGASATVTIKVKPQTTGAITNSADVIAVTTDPNTANNSASAETTVTPIPGLSANLSLTKTSSPAQVFVGDLITYDLSVTNGGSDAASGVAITDVLPAGLAFADATPSQGDCVAVAQTVTCDLGTLNSGATATAQIRATAQTVGAKANDASVASGVFDPDTSNNAASATSQVLPTPTPPTTTPTQTQGGDSARCRGLKATITGTPDGETIKGSPRRDVIAARGGKDRVKGRGGNDLVCGGAGNDSLYGGSGADLLRGGAGNDALFGGPQFDRLRGGKGTDRCPDNGQGCGGIH